MKKWITFHTSSSEKNALAAGIFCYKTMKKIIWGLLSVIFSLFVIQILWLTPKLNVHFPTRFLKKNSLSHPCFTEATISSIVIDKGYNPFMQCSDINGRNKDLALSKYKLPYGTLKTEFLFRSILRLLDEDCEFGWNEEKMNNAPVSGYENDVGTKTTFRMAYPESLFISPEDVDPKSTLIFMSFKPSDLHWMLQTLQNKNVSNFGFWTIPPRKLQYSKEQVRLLNPRFIRIAAYEFLNFSKRPLKEKIPQHPTTGMIAITMALHMCNNVSIAGFRYRFDNVTDHVHYYGNETMNVIKMSPYHNVSVERKFIDHLKKRKIIQDLTNE
ncbi:type 2 lactosamine alpha-2,3-sialyltransferase-like isoform X3 [Erpetoichthys calabaricus]|uniref:ST3 beta-galactoside alpha-2,3-sialyltransferase 6 n=1 Tax=Erpetoichthys calabaricus TaxID=27687 RepID=A0A8C4SL19_ERPCA|nr:type 2 lactosamine alpha-2,3-sialyltransferase-like isoform X3 [Erpetoichthys calabaricus]